MKQTITRAESQDIATLLIDVTKDKLDPSVHRHEVAVAMCQVFCEGLVRMFPEKAKNGQTILEIMGEFVAKYPALWGVGDANSDN